MVSGKYSKRACYFEPSLSDFHWTAQNTWVNAIPFHQPHPEETGVDSSLYSQTLTPTEHFSQQLVIGCSWLNITLLTEWL